MTSIPFIIGLVLLAALIVTFVVPGGIFVAPVLLIAAAIWAVARLVGSHRDGTAAGPE
jgi:hypothetical protein